MNAFRSENRPRKNCYFDPEEDKRNGEANSLTGYYYVKIKNGGKPNEGKKND